MCFFFSRGVSPLQWKFSFYWLKRGKKTQLRMEIFAREEGGREGEITVDGKWDGGGAAATEGREERRRRRKGRRRRGRSARAPPRHLISSFFFNFNSLFPFPSGTVSVTALGHPSNSRENGRLQSSRRSRRGVRRDELTSQVTTSQHVRSILILIHHIFIAG